MRFVPTELDIRLAAHTVGMTDRDYRAKVIKLGLVEINERGKVVRKSHERLFGFALTPERYLEADHRRDAAREYQRRYYHSQKQEAGHAVAV